LEAVGVIPVAGGWQTAWSGLHRQPRPEEGMGEARWAEQVSVEGPRAIPDEAALGLRRRAGEVARRARGQGELVGSLAAGPPLWQSSGR